MWYLFLQIWVWLIVAFALGWFAHWFFCCRDQEQDDGSPNNTLFDSSSDAIVEAKEENTSLPASAAVNSIDDSSKPQGFIDAPEQIDDLKRIKGVGAVLEKTLN